MNDIANRVFGVLGKPILNQQWVFTDYGEVVNSSTIERTPRHPTWYDLLFDLALVVSLLHAASSLIAQDLTDNWRRVGDFALIFFPLHYQWIVVNNYSNVFEAETVADALFVLTNIIGVLGAATSVEVCYSGNDIGSEDSDCARFTTFILILRLAIVVMNVRAALFLSAARTFGLYLAVSHIISGILWCFLIWASQDGLSHMEDNQNSKKAIVLSCWILAIAIEYVIRWIPLWNIEILRNRSIPANVALLTERIGMLTILSLGTMFGGIATHIIANTMSGNQKAQFYWMLVGGAYFGFLAKSMYFSVLDCLGERCERHAFSRRRQQGLAFVVVQIPIIMCISLVTSFVNNSMRDVGIAAFRDDFPEGSAPFTFLNDFGTVSYESKQLFVISAGFLLISCATCRVLHLWQHHWTRDAPFYICFVFGIILSCVATMKEDHIPSPVNCLIVVDATFTFVALTCVLARHWNEPSVEDSLIVRSALSRLARSAAAGTNLPRQTEVANAVAKDASMTGTGKNGKISGSQVSLSPVQYPYDGMSVVPEPSAASVFAPPPSRAAAEFWLRFGKENSEAVDRLNKSQTPTSRAVLTDDSSGAATGGVFGDLFSDGDGMNSTLQAPLMRNDQIQHQSNRRQMPKVVEDEVDII